MIALQFGHQQFRLRATLILKGNGELQRSFDTTDNQLCRGEPHQDRRAGLRASRLCALRHSRFKAHGAGG